MNSENLLRAKAVVFSTVGANAIVERHPKDKDFLIINPCSEKQAMRFCGLLGASGIINEKGGAVLGNLGAYPRLEGAESAVLSYVEIYQAHLASGVRA